MFLLCSRQQAAQDVSALISRVSPAVVVLELDPERERKLLEQVPGGGDGAARWLKAWNAPKATGGLPCIIVRVWQTHPAVCVLAG